MQHTKIQPRMFLAEVEDSPTFVGFVRLPGRAKLSWGLAGDMMGENGCLYESWPALALASRLPHYLVTP